jgi:hypothetical protein
VNVSQILTKVLKYTGLLAVLLIVVGGTIGFLVDGTDGLVSVLLGTAVAILFSAVTAASMIVAVKFQLAAFFGIVMGSWLLKMVLFIVALLVLRDLSFINPVALFIYRHTGGNKITGGLRQRRHTARPDHAGRRFLNSPPIRRAGQSLRISGRTDLLIVFK